MNEQMPYAAQPIQPAAPKKKLKRHFILWVPLIALAMILLGQILGSILVGLCAGVFLPNLSDGAKFLIQYLSFIGIDLLVILYCALCEKPVGRSFLGAKHGGMRGNTLGQFALGLLWGFVLNGVCILVAWLHKDLDFSVGRFDAVYMICALVSVCVQSGAEELVTRGYMMGALRERYNVWVAIIVNSLFFGALHLLNTGITVLSFANIVLIGFAFSMLVYCFDSLWMCIALHTAWNFTQNFLFGLPNSGIVSQSSFLHLEAARHSVFYDAVFGIEGTITAVIVVGLFTVLVIVRGRKKVRA